MKVLFIVLSFLTIQTMAFGQMSAQGQQSIDKQIVTKTYQDIEKTLGMVPDFLKQFPQEGINGAWEDMKGLQLNPKTALSGKYKELIGIAVAAQIPCRFCVYFHRQAAILNGASEREINEAVALAGFSRRWGTVLGGMQIDENEFKNDVNKLQSAFAKKSDMQAMEVKPAPLNNAQDVYNEVQSMLGYVPTFIRNYPQTAVVGAWKEYKMFVMNPSTALPLKMKDLVRLGVSSQASCKNCVYYDTQLALANGATKEELNEAIGMAGITREWSTVLNGQYTDEAKFIQQVDKIMKYVKSQSAKEVTSAN